MSQVVTEKMGGKVILFGEHSVVYGYSAVAVPIQMFSYCKIYPTPLQTSSISFPDFQQKWTFQKPKDLLDSISLSFRQYAMAFSYIKSLKDYKFKPLRIKLTSNLWSNAGLGSSASTSAVFLASLMKYFNVEYTKKELNNLTYKCEKIVHGSPSGIDNSVITQNKPILYKNQKIQDDIIKKSFNFLISYSNQERNTKLAIRTVNKFFKSHPKEISNLFSQIEDIVYQGLDAINNGNFEQLGKLFNQNHRILKSLHLSTNNLEKIRRITLKCGCYGTKITGAGLGGCLISIGSINNLEKTQNKLENLGFPSKIV